MHDLVRNMGDVPLLDLQSRHQRYGLLYTTMRRVVAVVDAAGHQSIDLAAPTRD